MTDFNIASFQEAVEKHWKHHANCNHLSWGYVERGDGVFKIEVAPIFQEVYGGENDGKKVWPGFEIILSDLFAEPGIEVDGFGVVSLCQDCNPTPIILFKGKYQGNRFVMKLLLEPAPNSEPVEFIDTIKGEVRTIEETHHG